MKFPPIHSQTENEFPFMKKIVIAACIASATFSSHVAYAEGGVPWLPIPGQVSLSIFNVEQSGKQAYIGDTQLPLSAITGGAATKYKRSSIGARFDYGITDSLALDATLARASVKVGTADNSSGLADSTIGLRWRILDEYEQASLPTLTIRAAAIIKGNYEADRLAAIGKGANGAELSVIVGKELNSQFALWGELGVQSRNSSVPTASFVDVGTRWRFAPKWSATFAYSNKRHGGNLDIGGAGFTPARFQQVREERGVAKVGVGYAIGSNQSVGVNVSKLVSGRNTVKDDSVVGVNYTYSF
jgi:hypothetical protein